MALILENDEVIDDGQAKADELCAIMQSIHDAKFISPQTKAFFDIYERLEAMQQRIESLEKRLMAVQNAVFK